MDPNETLRRLRALNETYAKGGEVDAEEVLELFEALDLWISTGGFLPESWKQKER